MARPTKHSGVRDRTEFVLEKKQWAQFLELLERSARVKPELQKLFSKPSVFSGP